TRHTTICCGTIDIYVQIYIIHPCQTARAEPLRRFALSQFGCLGADRPLRAATGRIFRHAKTDVKSHAGKGLLQYLRNFSPRSHAWSAFGDLCALQVLAWIVATPSARSTSQFYRRFKLAHLIATQLQNPANNSVRLTARSQPKVSRAKES